MSRIKSIRYILSILLLFVAAVSVYFSLYTLSTIRPVSDYKDMGVYTFIPNEVYPKPVSYTHLDVYKRQWLPFSWRPPFFLHCIGISKVKAKS